MPIRLKPLLIARPVTSYVTETGEVRELKDPGAHASPFQLWRLNRLGLLALVRERPRSITMAAAMNAIAYAERERTRHVARLEREIARNEALLEEIELDIKAHDAALAYLELESWQESARVAGYRDGSAARQAVELRTDLHDEPGARLQRPRQHRIGRLAWLEGARERQRAGKAVPP
jgi:hypothetical protein